MKIASAIREFLLLTGNATIPEQIYTVHIPQGIRGRYVLIQRDGDDPNNHLGGVSGLQSGEFSIDCFADDPDDSADIALAIKDELEPYTGGLPTETDADWQCKGIWWNSESDGYLAPDAANHVSGYYTTITFSMHYERGE